MMKMVLGEELEGDQKNWLVRRTMYAHTANVRKHTLANVHYTSTLKETTVKMRKSKKEKLPQSELTQRLRKELIFIKYSKSPRLKNMNAGLILNLPTHQTILIRKKLLF